MTSLEPPAEGGSDEDTDRGGIPRETLLSLLYAGSALAAVAAWVLFVDHTTDLAPFTFAVLIAASFLAERIALPLTPRSFYTVSTPIVLLTGLVGGPLAGAVAGAATAVGDDRGDWKRRLTYGGLNSFQGFVAGLAGFVAVGGTQNALVCAVLASAAFLVTNIGGRHIICRVRGIDPRVLARSGTIMDTTETLVSLPVLALLLQSNDTSGPTLMLLTIVALLVALQFGTRARAHYQEEIRKRFEEARTDMLTGAPNRRAYDEELERVVARVRRGELPAALLVFDIDHFKRVNTDHSWEGGDALLQAIVDRVGSVLRTTDQLFRRGGEEFCVIAPGVRDADALRELGDKIRGFVKVTPFQIGGAAVPVTVSVGATMIDGLLLPSEADAVANEALGEAKQERDRLVIRLPFDVASAV
jgi:diguanylate cyclase (GGDEF)-like protein